MFAPVKGRLPHGWSIEAHYTAKGKLKITSPDTDKFLIYVDTESMHEYRNEYQKTWVKLDKDSSVESKYDEETGILRFDSHTYPEFWIEVKVKALSEGPRKKQKTSDQEKEEEEEEEEKALPWSKIDNDGVLTLWPNTLLRECDLYGPKSVHWMFEKIFDIEVTPVGCVETLPDVVDGEKVVGTGGRIDFFFFVKPADVPKFALKRFEYGMRWWEDVLYEHEDDIYPIEFREAYPV